MCDNREIHTLNDLQRFNRSSTYALRNLCDHLFEAGYYEKLLCLLIGNQAWMKAKFSRFGSDAEYADDLELALRQFVDPPNQQQLSYIVQLQTAFQIVSQRALSYSLNALDALVWLDRHNEALGHARL